MFVIEGEAPELKWQTMADRQQVRQGKPAGGKAVKATARRANRSHFKTVIREVNTKPNGIYEKGSFQLQSIFSTFAMPFILSFSNFLNESKDENLSTTLTLAT